MPIDMSKLLLAAGGQIIGKVRLQKAVYLLDQIGMNSEFEFDYHHYGPYSAELANQVEEDVVFKEIEEDSQQRASDGVSYSIYRTKLGTEAGNIGDLSFDAAQTALAAMHRHTATVLELAATIHWLSRVENVDDWKAELARRKGVKAAEGRDNQALDLLTELGIAPAA